MASIEGKFIQFGCWNQGFCSDVADPNPITRVMHTLKEYIAEPGNKPDFIVVAGDNYYPLKVETDILKTKYIEPVIMASGFDCLPKDIPIDMILGNHDLETNLKDNLFIENDSVKEKGDCFITTNEIALARRNNIALVVNKSRLFGGHTLVLMIDTSMYDDSDVTDMLPCYRKMAGYEDIPDVATLRAKQWEFIAEELGKYPQDRLKNIIIIGHHPITGYKYSEKIKDGKTKETFELMNGFTSFIDMLVNGIYAMTKKDKLNYYYLCADTHLYQEGTVELEGKMTIQQYIVGTGGSKLDLDPKLSKKIPIPRDYKPHEFNNDTIIKIGTYTMSAEQLSRSKAVHGFLECVYRDTNLTFKFIPISASEGASEGGSRKRHIQKYKPLSKIRKTYRKTIKKKRSIVRRRKTKNKRIRYKK